MVKLVVDASSATDIKTLGSLTKVGEALEVDITAPISEVVNLSANSPFLPVSEDAGLVEVRVTRKAKDPRPLWWWLCLLFSFVLLLCFGGGLGLCCCDV